MQNISYELVGNGSKGLSQGALVHFSEAFVNNSTDLTKTPWIALVSCDHNETSASQVDDIFTLARDRGAVGALLYSLYSYACVINPEYADPTTFDQVFDIFSTQSLTSSRLIEYQFGQLGSMNESFAKMYNDYNASRLNASYDMVHNSIQDGNVLTNGYLIASLVAFNATETSNFTLANNNGNGQSGKNEKRSTTALAMIVLYAITGCVSALFCIVIISGAVRAIRHPERYGPRARMGDNGGMLQSRARGLTRAILDTFPVVKFGSNDHADQPSLKDVEHAHSSTPPLEMTSRMTEFKESQSQIENNDNSSITAVRKEVDTAPRQDVVSASDQASTSFARRSPQDISRTSREDVVPDAIGRDTCPICIVDFEEGDDLRILPCEGHHRFHQQCVDPWLLELSSSCPICRHDFLALENMLSGEDEEDEEAPPLQGPTVGNTHSRRSGRFSRYVRSAIQRHRRRRDEQVVSAPPVPSINAMPT
ncbi:hypothetical protein E1B28_000493 [Marasmius oreades]|uniref:RING-type domain-containing protein n=1 Tax=Marasmius oreades TaxID=181124 RepID=A0A9P7V1G1_9AGAR|nr:uncharacterized protein E1B28_000493 [Marasmius oreades]KAG7098559.1 hypothetical protein E1B28_000493 [Marasmius oreades]